MNTDKHDWGFELTWAATEHYTGKMVIVLNGKRSSLVYHKKQDLTLFVLEGAIQLEVEGQKHILNKGDSYHVSPKIMYRLNAFRGDVTLLEAGSKLEDDLVVVEA